MTLASKLVFLTCSAALPQYTFFYRLRLTTATLAITFANLAHILFFLETQYK
jgi:hypothetical protein